MKGCVIIRLCDELNRICSGNTSHIILPPEAESVWAKIEKAFKALCKSDNLKSFVVCFIADDNGVTFAKEDGPEEKTSFLKDSVIACMQKAREEGLYVEHVPVPEWECEMFYFYFTPSCVNPFASN